MYVVCKLAKCEKAASLFISKMSFVMLVTELTVTALSTFKSILLNCINRVAKSNF